MIFNSKQLEELENIHDASGIFEDSDDESGGDEVGEAAMEWRRQLIEEAVESVKRAKTRPLDPSITYEVNSLLFDRETRRFARVHRSVPGHLKIAYLNGGDREFGVLDVESYLKEFGAQKRLSELARQLGMIDDDVAVHLDALGIQPIEEPEEEEPAPAAEAPPAPPPRPVEAKGPPRAKATKPARPVFDEEEAEDEDEDEDEVEEDEDTEASADDDGDVDLDEDFDDEDEGDTPAAPKGGKGKAPPPALAKAQAKAAKAPPAKAVKSARPEKPTKPEKAAKPERALKNEKPAKGAKAEKGAKAPKGGINPIDDPNGFIKESYNTLSNREMARITGLSEHTIRRKLGEWGLKRTK